MTLFNKDAPIDGQAPVDDNSNGDGVLDTLVGEGKKFKDLEALAKAKLESDRHIARLEAEAALQREEIAKRATVEDFLDRIESRARTPENLNQGGSGNENQDGAKGLSPEEIKALVKQATLEEKTLATQEQNLQETVRELQKTWGNDWQVKLRNKQTELGLTEEFMNSIAFKSPKALLNLVGASGSTAKSAPDLSLPRGQQMANASVNSGVKNKAYWDKIRQTDPILYNSAAMTAERHRWAQKLKESFFE